MNGVRPDGLGLPATVAGSPRTIQLGQTSTCQEVRL
jgi:hypothetical protein